MSFKNRLYCQPLPSRVQLSSIFAFFVAPVGRVAWDVDGRINRGVPIPVEINVRLESDNLLFLEVSITSGRLRIPGR